MLLLKLPKLLYVCLLLLGIPAASFIWQELKAAFLAVYCTAAPLYKLERERRKQARAVCMINIYKVKKINSGKWKNIALWLYVEWGQSHCDIWSVWEITVGVGNPHQSIFVTTFFISSLKMGFLLSQPAERLLLLTSIYFWCICFSWSSQTLDGDRTLKMYRDCKVHTARHKPLMETSAPKPQ